MREVPSLERSPNMGYASVPPSNTPHIAYPQILWSKTGEMWFVGAFATLNGDPLKDTKHTLFLSVCTRTGWQDADQ